MKTIYSLGFLLGVALTSQAQVIQTQNNNTFAPSETIIELGQTVTFQISGIHTATQVSEATWMANGNVPLDGGFHFTAGTHEYTPTELGTIYFVCQPHASLGMKGTIIVETNTGVKGPASVSNFQMFPNPANAEINVQVPQSAELVLIDAQGRQLLQRMVNGSDRIDVSNLPEGNYSVMLRDAEGGAIGTQRLTITR